jgi:hypothetical protein
MPNISAGVRGYFQPGKLWCRILAIKFKRSVWLEMAFAANLPAMP